MSTEPAHTLPFSTRAELPDTPLLTTYLLRLISIKHSNLCVSADVYSTAALLRLAEEVGDSICVLKTHADIIDDFSERTIKGLKEVSRRKKFLLFEDRKFGDIGNTVQSQYARGPLCIASWAHITNAHLLPGPTIVPALRSAAHSALRSLSNSVSTDIYADSPRTSLDSDPLPDPPDDIDSDPDHDFDRGPSGRKPSIVTATTTISQTFESAVPALARTVSRGEGQAGDREEALDALGCPPLARGLLLLAEMSSEGNLITPSYTEACVDTAREYDDFVLGFVSQRNLNDEEGDNFVSFTPGVSLPPIGEMENRGDGKGQQYRTPRTVIVDEGVDVIIVGRGILGARNRVREVERYRRAAWEAYEQRIGRKERKTSGK